ncbi:recombinase RecB [Bowdeniella nasicola]|uniref:Recombinase RecB n=1 Tax=Bowdeniella nasicola TaxID=208480 RepID=A0A1Q5Q4W6_9ACTO|nr:recombinase RecB [Bowdeniella nasicola]
MQCPLLFRYRTVDRLPEPPSPDAAKGTLVHAVLERLYDAPPPERTVDHAVSLLPTQWEELRTRNPRIEALFATPDELATWLSEARALVENYFRIERPENLAPAARERFLEVGVGDGVLLRGFIDRVDVAPDGRMRIVDYKSGKSPRPQYTSEALFQMRFYALMVWRLTGTIPARLQLVYLADGQILTLDPWQDDLEAMEREILGIWASIEDAATRGEFRPRRTPLCPWCSFKRFCPEFGSDMLPLPQGGVERLLTARLVPGSEALEAPAGGIERSADEADAEERVDGRE